MCKNENFHQSVIILIEYHRSWSNQSLLLVSLWNDHTKFVSSKRLNNVSRKWQQYSSKNENQCTLYWYQRIVTQTIDQLYLFLNIHDYIKRQLTDRDIFIPLQFYIQHYMLNNKQIRYDNVELLSSYFKGDNIFLHHGFGLVLEFLIINYLLAIIKVHS